jgi:hypothetical protein
MGADGRVRGDVRKLPHRRVGADGRVFGKGVVAQQPRAFVDVTVMFDDGSFSNFDGPFDDRAVAEPDVALVQVGEFANADVVAGDDVRPQNGLRADDETAAVRYLRMNDGHRADLRTNGRERMSHCRAKKKQSSSDD